MGTIRQRSTGTWECRTSHKQLTRPHWSTHATRELAEAYDERIRAMLDTGQVTAADLDTAPVRQTAISVMLRGYLNSAPIAPSDRPTVQWLQENVAGTVEGLSYAFAEAFVRDLKARKLAPGTIRKRVESLARAVDWHNRREHELDAMPANPLRLLPRGYSSSGNPKRDIERDRRLLPGEQERIEAVLQGQKRPDRQRALEPDADLLRLFRLVVATGMRLREAYTLNWADVRQDQRTLYVRKSKTGKAREIPMSREVAALLAQDGRGMVFPFWSGAADDLDRCTRRLSARFAVAFDYAGCVDLTEHDLRHEACCRWVTLRDEAGRWMFRAEEIRRITGHKTEGQFQRYLSLRGSDLAERMW